MADKYIIEKMNVEDLESGMVTAENLVEADSDRILLFKDTVLDSVTIFNLKERYNIDSIRIKKKVAGADGIAEQIRKEINIHESLNTLKGVFGSDDDSPIERFSYEDSKKIGEVADALLTSLHADDNLLLKMHELQSYDDYTYKHCLRVAMMSITIGKTMQFEKKKLRELCEAALLHDIGKRKINVNIIRKPEKLTDAEFEEIKKHPTYGYYLLKESGMYSDTVLNAVLMHQEKFDGSGYPLGRKGEEISIFARIIAVADVYDALTSDRPYRKPWSVAEAEEFMMGGANTHFDYAVIEAFLATFAPYPVGERVILSDGRYGLVMSNNANVLRPVVRVLNGAREEIIDLYNDYKYLSLSIKKLAN